MEASGIVHESGHLMGLVDGGVPMVVPHEDSTSAFHDKDPACVRADVKTLNDVLQPTSICGLGYVAPIPLASALAYFRSDILKKPELTTETQRHREDRSG